MFNVHAYFDGQKVIDQFLPHIPRLGDTMRLATQSWWPITCSCPRDWTFSIEAHGWLSGDNE